MNHKKLIVLSTIFYFSISIFLGRFVSNAFLPIESHPLVGIFIGPAITLNRMHGVEFYLLATIFCLPSLWGALLLKNINLKLICLSLFVGVWISLGSFFR